MAFDFEGALNEGYSVQELSDHFKFDYASAQKEGYSDDEILEHLRSKQSAPKQQGIFEKVVGGRPDMADKTTEELVEELDRMSTAEASGRVVGGVIPGIAETAAEMITAIPEMMTQTGGAIGALAGGASTREELERAGQEATPEWASKMVERPETYSGTFISRALQDVFHAIRSGAGELGRGFAAGASFLQDPKAKTMTDVETKYEKGLEQARLGTELAFDVATLGTAAKAARRGKPREEISRPDHLADLKAQQDAKKLQQEVSGPVRGEQLDLFDETFFDRTPEIEAQRKAQAHAELEGMYRDAARYERQGDLFAPEKLPDSGLETPVPRAKPLEPMEYTPGKPELELSQYRKAEEPIPFETRLEREAQTLKQMEIDQAYSQRDAQRSAEFAQASRDLDRARPYMGDIFEPAQAAVQRPGAEVFGKRQRGAVHPDLLTWGVSKLWNYVVDKGMSFPDRRVLSKFVGTFDKPVLMRAMSEHRDPKSRSRLVWMEPSDFKEMAFSRERTMPQKAAREALSEEKRRPIREALKTERGLEKDTAIPMLMVEKGRIVGHEGRHRMDVFEELGLDRVPVVIRDSLHRNEGGPLPYKNIVTENGATVQPRWKEMDLSGPTAEQVKSTLGKGQRGAWTPFAKKEITAEDLRRQYRTKYGEELDLDIAQKKADQMNSEAGIKKAVSKIPGMKKAGDEQYKKYDPFDREEAVRDIKSSEDLTADPSWYTKVMAPRGYLAKEIMDNPAINAGYSVVKGIIDSFANKSEQILFHKGGIWDRLTHGEKLFRPGEMSNVMAQLIAAKGDPNFKFNLPPKQMALVEQIRNQFNQQLKEVNEVRAKQGKSPIADIPNYFPGFFDGPFVFEVRSAAGGKPILMTGHNKHTAGLRATWLKSKGFNVGRVKKREAVTSERFGTDNLVAEYEMLLDMMQDDSALALRKSIDSAIQADATTAAGYHNRFKTWHGYKGTLGDNPFFSPTKNYYNGKEAIKRSVEAHNQWMAANELAAFEKELTAAGKSNAPIAEGMIQKYIRDNLGITEEPFVSNIQGLVESVVGTSNQRQRQLLRKYADFSTTQMLGNSFRALSQNFFQPLEATLPKLLQLTKNPIDITTPMLHGLKDYMQVLMLHQGQELAALAKSLTKLDAGIPDRVIGARANELYQYATSKGIIDITMLESTPLFKRKATNALYKYGGGLMTRASEQAARFATFSALTRYLIDAGWEKSKAMSQAGEWTTAHMVDYTASGKASILANTGIVGEALGRLQTYKVNNMGRFFSYMKYASKHKDATPLIAMLGINMSLAGIQGLIGFDVVAGVMDFLANKDRDEKDFSTRAYVAENVPDWATYGILSDVTGLGFFNAFSQQVFGDDPVQSILPVWMNAIEHGRTIGRRLTVDPREETRAEFGRELKSIAPQMLQPQVDKRFLTEEVEGRKLAISPYTGQPTHEYSPEEKSFSNVMSFERAKSSFLRHEMRKEADRFATARKDTMMEISSLVQDVMVYGNDNPFKQKKLADSINKYYSKYGGSDEGLNAIIDEAGMRTMIPDQAVRILEEKGNKGKLSTSDIVELKRALKYQKLQGTK